MEKLLGAQITEHFPRVVVEPRLDPLDFPGRDGAEVCALWNVPTDQSVLVFVGSPLARPVWVAVVDLRALALASMSSLDPVGVGELAAVVAGYGHEDPGKQRATRPLEPIDGPHDAQAGLVRQR